MRDANIYACSKKRINAAIVANPPFTFSVQMQATTYRGKINK